MQYELLVDSGRDDDKGLWFSYLCPQAYEYVETKYKILKVPQVRMLQFPLSSLAPQLLPNGCAMPDTFLPTTVNLMAIYYGLERFSKRVGMMPVEVLTASGRAADRVNGIRSHGLSPIELAWCKAIFNIKWLGVRATWVVDPVCIRSKLGYLE